MKKLRLFIKVLSIAIVLALLAITALVLTFDPNNYKDTITAQVESQTGRDFEIAGDIKLSVFPWVGIKVEGVTLANAAGFSDQAFARISQLDVKVKVLPLLRKQLEVDKIRIHGLFASLEVDRTGRNNWSDLAKGEEGKPAQQQKEKPPAPADVGDQSPVLAALAVNGIELVDATVMWRDDQSGIESQLAGFNLTTGAIRFNQPVDIKFDTRVRHNAPAIDATINLTTRVEFNQAFTLIKANALALRINADAPELFKDKLEVALQGDIQADMDRQLASLENMRVSAVGATLYADLEVNQLLEGPEISGSIRTDAMNAREVAGRLGIELPPMAGQKALTSVAVKSQVTANAKQARLDNIRIDLDNSQITGWVNVADIAQQKVRYKLHMTAINADAYMAPPVVTNKAAQPSVVPAGGSGRAGTPAAAADPEIGLPVELLRSLDLQGVLTMASVTVTDIPLTDILVKTQAAAGVVRIDPLKLSALDGSVNASVVLNVKGDTPRYTIGLKASDMQAGPVVNPVLVGMTGEKDVTLDGAVSVSADIKTRGRRVSALKKAATGNVRFNMGKTVLQGVDVEYYMRNVVADYLTGKGLNVPAEWRGSFDPESKTALYRIRASAVVANGELTNKDLLIDSSRFRVTGKGVINIMRNDMDYRALIDIEPTRKKTVAEKLLDQPLLLRIYGPFEQLSYDIDKTQLKNTLSKMLKAEAKAKINKEIEKEKEKLRQKAKQEEEQYKQKLKDKLKNKLKGLF